MKTVRKLSALMLILVVAFSCAKKDSVTPKKDPDPKTTPDKLTVTTISPDYGKAGAEITITGTGFSATISADVVTIDGKTATVKTATTTQLTVTAPADATHGAVTVKVGTTTVNGPTFYYEPIITSISAATGKAGDVITITGKNFGTTAADFEVKFNGVTAEITTATATALTVKVPATATNGAITVARKAKTAVTGPAFSVTTGGSEAGGFTVTDGSITITNLLKNTSSYGSILCFTIDEAHNILYAGTISQILKIDLSTGTVSTIIMNSAYITLTGSKPSAMDVGPDGKLYVLTDVVTVFGVPTTGGNLFAINTSANTATLVGNKFIGLNLGGGLGDSVPFIVTADNEFITVDGAINTVVKYSSNLSVRTIIKAFGALENFSHVIKNTDNSIRIVTQFLFTKSYYDYKTTLSAKKDYPATLNAELVSITRGGTSFYGIKGKYAADASATSNHTQYTIGKLNAGQTDFQKKASFTIDGYREIATIKNYDFIGLNGKTYFYADKNDNMYALVLSFANNETAGLIKFKIN